MINVFAHALIRAACCLCLLACALPVWALPPATLGVLAFRPKPETLARWQPTADHLSARIGRPVVLEILTYPELEAAIVQRRIDFVLTNPAHYVLMASRNGLSSPVATLIPLDQGQPIPQFGGVIFSRADRNDIAGLSDLRGKTIATPDADSFGGYQMQAYELAKIGLSMTRDVNLVTTGMPHDKVVDAVLAGQADAGFIRTGLIEAMNASGRLDPTRLHVLDRRHEAGFPFLLSTSLYPEWPIAAMPHTDPELARMLASALIALRPDHPAARQGQYYGWSEPADYEPVRNVLHTLRLPPFDQIPEFTLAEVLRRHGPVIGVVSVATLLIFILLVLLMRRQTQLREQEHRLAEERRQLLDALGEGVFGMDLAGRCTFVNLAALEMLGFSEDELLGLEQHGRIHHHHSDGRPYPSEDCPILQSLADGRLRRGEEWFLRKDGSGFPVDVTAAPIESGGKRIGAVVVFHDITARKEAQARDKLLVSALEAVANGIVITDPDASIRWVNPAFEQLTGYPRDEAMGRKPADLVKSGLQDRAFYEEMWRVILAGRTWRGEVINKKRDGSLYDEELTIAPVLDDSGVIRHFVGIKQDITARKRMQEELHSLASTDPLTGLPNRRHFMATLEQESARIRRFPEVSATLMMLDLDHFKQVNDSHGHAAGDGVLQRFSVLVRDGLRKTDLAGRLGGEEFAILLIGSNSSDAVEFAERLRQEFDAEHVMIDGKCIHTTVSIGVTSLRQGDASGDEALARADAALYQAKANGRNRVEVV
ncbi:MAG: diguanylate cyclase [Rhodocyclaceae bacterium]|nr:diguanylate cyclase [Rhodocyclaceae bacterium]